MSNYPSTIKFESASFTSQFRTLSTDNPGNIRIGRKTGWHSWRLTAEYPPLDKDQFMDIFGFMLAQKGREGSFFISVPGKEQPRGTAEGLPVVSGASQTGGTLDVSGCDPSQAAFLRQGDLFSVEGAYKVYMITEDITSDGFGLATLVFTPDLVSAPLDLAGVKVTDVRLLVSSLAEEVKYTVVPPLVYSGLEIELEEVSDLFSLWIPFATWNDNDKGSLITLSDSDLVANHDASQVWSSVRANVSLTKGNHQWDIVTRAALANVIVGLANENSALGPALFTAAGEGGMGYYGASGDHIFNGVFDPYGDIYGSPDTDVITIFYLADVGEVYYALNDIMQNESDPTLRINPAITGVPPGLFPIVGHHGTGFSLLLSDPALMPSTPRAGFTQGLRV